MKAESHVDRPQAKRLPVGRIAQWLLVSALAIAVFSLLCVHAPSRIKLLGLFAIVQGAVAGWLLGKFCRPMRVHFQTMAAVIGFVMIAVAQIGMSLEAYRLFAAAIREEYKDDPSAMLFNQSQAPADPAERARLNQMIEQNRRERADKLDKLTSFTAFLINRVKALALAANAAIGFYVGEILLSALVGAWLVARAAGAKFCGVCDYWHEPQRAVVVDGRIATEALALLESAPQISTTESARVTVISVSCRCPDASAEFRFEGEDPRGRQRLLAAVSPDREASQRLMSLLDDGN